MNDYREVEKFLEQQNKGNVMITLLSGSRGYGIGNEDSDFDLIQILMPDKDKLIELIDTTSVSKQSSPFKFYSDSPEFDVKTYSFKRYLELAYGKQGANSLELASAWRSTMGDWDSEGARIYMDACEDYAELLFNNKQYSSLMGQMFGDVSVAQKLYNSIDFTKSEEHNNEILRKVGKKIYSFYRVNNIAHHFFINGKLKINFDKTDNYYNRAYFLKSNKYDISTFDYDILRDEIAKAKEISETVKDVYRDVSDTLKDAPSIEEMNELYLDYLTRFYTIGEALKRFNDEEENNEYEKLLRKLGVLVDEHNDKED